MSGIRLFEEDVHHYQVVTQQSIKLFEEICYDLYMGYETDGPVLLSRRELTIEDVTGTLMEVHDLLHEYKIEDFARQNSKSPTDFTDDDWEDFEEDYVAEIDELLDAFLVDLEYFWKKKGLFFSKLIGVGVPWSEEEEFAYHENNPLQEVW